MKNQKGKMMFRATCSECGKPCEVPFLPIDGKPVYCPECFAKKFPPKASRPNKPSFQNPAPAGDRQLSEINAKLDRLISVIEKMNFSASVAKAAKAEPKAAKKTAPKKPAKKAPVKKKK